MDLCSMTNVLPENRVVRKLVNTNQNQKLAK